MAVDLLEFEQFREELPRSKIFGSSPRSDKIWTHQERRNAVNGMAEDGKVCVNYGEEEEFSVVDYDCNTMHQSPSSLPPPKRLDDPFDDSPNSVTSVPSYIVENTPHVNDLLHRSPRLERQPAREHLRPVEVASSAPSIDSTQPTQSYETIVVEIPNVETRLLDRLPSEVRTRYVEWAVNCAKRNMKELNIRLMLYVDGRAPAVFQTDLIDNEGAIEHWMEEELTESSLRAPYVPDPSAGRYKISDHAIHELGEVEEAILLHQEEEDWRKEHSRFHRLTSKLGTTEKLKPSEKPTRELEQWRAQAREMDFSGINMSTKQKNHLRELEAMEVIRKEIIGGVRLERANEKAKMILGTGTLPYPQDDSPIKKGMKKHKPGLSIFTGHKKRWSKSLTDMTSTSNKQPKPRHSIDVLSKFTWGTAAKDDFCLPDELSDNDMSPYSRPAAPVPPPKDDENTTPKALKHSTPLTTPRKLLRKRSSSMNDTHPLKGREMTWPYHLIESHEEAKAIEEKPEKVSITSSDYSGDGTPIKKAERYEMVAKKEVYFPKKTKLASPTVGGNFLDRMQAKADLESAKKTVTEASNNKREAKRAMRGVEKYSLRHDLASRKFEDTCRDYDIAARKQEEAEQILQDVYHGKGKKQSSEIAKKKYESKTAIEHSPYGRSPAKVQQAKQFNNEASYMDIIPRSAETKGKAFEAKHAYSASDTTLKAPETPKSKPATPSSAHLAGMTMFEKMEALKRAAAPSSSPVTARKISAPTSASIPTKTSTQTTSSSLPFDPFAAMPTLLKPVDVKTPLGSHPPTKEDKAFAKSLHLKNKIAKMKVELRSPSKATFKGGEWRPKTAPEVGTWVQ